MLDKIIKNINDHKGYSWLYRLIINIVLTVLLVIAVNTTDSNSLDFWLFLIYCFIVTVLNLFLDYLGTKRDLSE